MGSMLPYIDYIAAPWILWDMHYKHIQIISKSNLCHCSDQKSADPCRWSEKRPSQNWLNLPKQLIFFGKKHVFMFPGKSIIDILWKLFRSLFPWSMEKKTSWLAKDHFSILFNSCSPLFPGNKENFMALTPWQRPWRRSAWGLPSCATIRADRSGWMPGYPGVGRDASCTVNSSVCDQSG